MSENLRGDFLTHIVYPYLCLCMYMCVCVQVGALSSLPSGEVNPHDGSLTFLGRVLSQLPVDIRLGKLMLLGHVFGVLEETVIISAY